MMVDGDLADREGREELTSEKSKTSSKKNRKRPKKSAALMPSAIQRLFDTCQEVFADGSPGLVPPPDDVRRLQSILGTLTPADVDLGPKMPFFRSSTSTGLPVIKYLHLYDCPKFSICIFCLPPKAVIPLHNHPGMTVFSKLLFGSMHIRSYDWVEVPQGSNEKIISSNGACLAKLDTDAVFKAPCETSILYPSSGGNLHRFTAVTACAVLDVLGPPYDDPERPCTYYNEFPYSHFQGDAAFVPDETQRYFWLEARESKPESFKVIGGEYTGPQIVVH